MIENLVAETKKMMVETGNHRDWCAAEVAEKLTDEQFVEFAHETGSKRYIRKIEFYANYAGEYGPASEMPWRSRAAHREDVCVRAVESTITEKIRGE